MKVTENLKLQYVNNIQTTASQVNHIHDSDTELADKITQKLIEYLREKGKPSFKKRYNYCRR